MTFMSADTILFGTGEGFGPMQSRDIVEIDIEGIGRLQNPVGQADENGYIVPETHKAHHR